MPKLELPKVLLKMLLRDPDMRAVYAALEGRPEGLNGVRVDLTSNKFLAAMSDRAMAKAMLVKFVKSQGVVAGDLRSRQHPFANRRNDMIGFA
ncbi:hypothetical protein MnTg02_00139 [bacterium MnTg02]|nr:hypothetical protein MnTg02_00139 [bacterium MnTg02]